MVTDKTGLEIGYRNGMFTIDTNQTFVDKIYNYEIGFSLAVLTGGYHITCMLPRYQNKNYLSEDMKTNCHGVYLSDPFDPNAYFGGNVDRLRQCLFEQVRSGTWVM